MTTNTIKAELEKVQMVIGYLAMADQDFIVSPVYVQNGIEFKDIIWFSTDGGNLCRDIMNTIGGKYRHTINGVEVA